MLEAPGDLLDEIVRAHRHRWTHTDELLALVLTKLDELTILTAQIWSKKSGGRPPRPYVYPRPHPKRRRETSSLDTIRRFFAR